MGSEFLAALFIIGVGLSVAGAGTHLYQAIWRQQAMLRFDGRSYLGTLGHLFMSFVCGPYIMLQLGWQHERGGALSISSVLLSAFIAFGWSFILGLFAFSIYLAIFG